MLIPLDELNKGIRITFGKEYPLLDSETQQPVPTMVGRYFYVEIDYLIEGEKRLSQPTNMFLKYFLILDRNCAPKTLEEELGRYWVKCAIEYLGDRSFYIHLDELVLGAEGELDIHTLKAKGRAYLRSNTAFADEKSR